MSEAKNPEVKEKELTPVALQDFTGDIEAYLDKMPMYEKAVDRIIPVSSRMWTLFSAIVDTMVQDEYVKNFGDFKEDPMYDNDHLMNALNTHLEAINSDILVEQNLLNLAFMSSLAYLRVRGYDTLFLKTPEGTKDTEPDSTEVATEDTTVE